MELHLDRRQLLQLAGVVTWAVPIARPTALAEPAAQLAPAFGPGTTVVRVFADAEGNSHLQELTLAATPNGQSRRSQVLPATGMYISQFLPSDVVDWHTTSTPLFAINIEGEIDLEVSGGIRRRMPSGTVAFLEDTTGKGHVTRMVGRVTNLFIRVAPGFDVVAWAKGQG